jgi:cation diffusion facilitator CzcD-associated flavoprotein CzcO
LANQLRELDVPEEWVHEIVTKFGELLEADIIITATAFNLSLMGDMAFDVEAVDFGNTYTYRGLMNSGAPNMSFMFG